MINLVLEKFTILFLHLTIQSLFSPKFHLGHSLPDRLPPCRALLRSHMSKSGPSFRRWLQNFLIRILHETYGLGPDGVSDRCDSYEGFSRTKFKLFRVWSAIYNILYQLLANPRLLPIRWWEESGQLWMTHVTCLYNHMLKYFLIRLFWSCPANLLPAAGTKYW